MVKTQSYADCRALYQWEVSSRLIFFLFLNVLAHYGRGQNPRSKPLTTGQPPLAVQVTKPLRWVPIDGQMNVVYELHLYNQAVQPVQLKRIDVSNKRGTEAILTYRQADIKQRFYTPGELVNQADSIVLKPDRTGIVYIELRLDNQTVPDSLIHRLTYQYGAVNGPSVVDEGVIPLSRVSPIVLGPPLRSGPWVAIYNPVWPRGHRRVFFTTNGVAHLPGRFAIDFIKVGQKGQLCRGNSDLIRHWYGYGQVVIAVSDGVVSSIRTDFVESATLSRHPDYASEQATGNYLSLKVADHQYVFYEHLKPGSIRVKPGQRVKKGQVLARVGFTGQSTGPHLHLHVADADSPLGAEGLPFVVDHFTLLGSYPDYSQLGKAPWQATIPQARPVRKEYPSANSVVSFR